MDQNRIIRTSTKIFAIVFAVLYTAITRARELLITVGQERTIAAMTENCKTGRRYTGLKLRLQGKDS